MEIESMFEYASRSKLRFVTVRGDITVEDLWDLPLTSKAGMSLDDIAKSYAIKLRDAEEVSFVVKASKQNADDSLRLEILKHVIAVRMQEDEDRKNAAAKRVQRNKIDEILASKQEDDLKSKTIEELMSLRESI